ncbi:MAG TPA: methyltransferase domain-containing protein [Candidatus Dormibacteraeota bacterium]|nr:methyltransferase domain-containing protein [Candidatus Dormibacteraeota bacterium]
MTYSDLVESAPPGAREFGRADLERLPPEVIRAGVTRMPRDERRLYEQGDPDAGTRFVRSLFWELVYHLRPQLWDQLSQVEPIHPALLAALPADGVRVLEVGAGSGRLTANLAGRARMLIATEPVEPLREMLEERVPAVAVLEATADDVPVPNGWADLTVSCAALGPEGAPFTELERCTRAGGTLALISPRQPGWFASHGWRLLSFDAAEVEVLPHDPGLEAFFGPLDPPHELLLRTV